MLIDVAVADIASSRVPAQRTGAETVASTTRARLLVRVVLATFAVGTVATVALHLSTGPTSATSWWLGNLLLMASTAPLGALIAVRRPASPIGWLFLASGASQVWCALGREWLVRGLLGHAAPGWRVVGWLADPAFVISVVCFAAVMLLVPDIDVRAPSLRRWRVWMSVVVVLVATTWLTPNDETAGHRTWHSLSSHWVPSGLANVLDGLALLALASSLLAGGTAIVVRFRRSRGERRIQLKWIAWASCIAAAEILTEFIPGNPVSTWTGPITVGLLSGSITIAMLRHRLFNIDVVIERTIVFALVSGTLVGGYLAIVLGIGSAIGQPVDLGPPLLATVFVALAFAPLRQRIQDVVERRLFGDRSDPGGAMSRLGQQIASSGVHSDLAMLLRTVGQSLQVPGVSLLDVDGQQLASVGNLSLGECLDQPLIYAGRKTGTLRLTARTPRGSFSRKDMTLIHALAPQVAAAVHAVTLSQDLQGSRQRLVTAKEEEQRRLRRDLHDGVGPAIAALGLKVDAAGVLVGTRPDDARRLLRDVKDDLRGTLDDVRRLVYGLRPPALDQLGLIGALDERASALNGSEAGAGVTFTVVGDSTAVPLPAAVEVAAYRIATEAMTNVVRHADATRCTVRVVVRDVVHLEVSDDGKGVETTWTAGVGTSSMGERARELGGWCRIEPRHRGTVVTAELPLLDLVGHA